MKAGDYLKEKARMTKGRCSTNYECSKCPFNHKNNGKQVSCTQIEEMHPELAVKIVEKWAKEHPVKTYLSVLLEKLPKTSINEHGVPKTCPDALFGKSAYFDSCNCPYECVKCWNREYKEEK